MSTTTDTPRPRGAARRTVLLQATLALLAEHGADALTHRRVAERAGVPLASTTYWFDSKEHLLTEALRFAAQRDEDRLRAAGELLTRRCDAAGRRPTPAEIVSVVVDCDLPAETGSTDPTDVVAADRGALLAAYALMLESARRPGLQALSREWTDVYEATIGGLFARAGSGRATDDARLLIAAADGLFIDRLSTGSEDASPPRAELERLVTALLPRAR